MAEPWNLTEVQRRQFRDAQIAARAQMAAEAAPDPAADLREAAACMRREDPAQFGQEFWTALADWLEQSAAGYETLAASPFGQQGVAFVAGDGGDLDPAIRTARAYLGIGER
jgi:hypothetical protein